MIERVLEQQAAICATLVERKRMDLLLSDGDVKLSEKLLQVLQPFNHVTKTASAEKYATISSIRPLLHHLVTTVLSVKDGDSSALQRMKRVMAENLQSRYSSAMAKKRLGISCFMDPRFKELPFLTSEEREDIRRSVREEAAQFIQSRDERAQAEEEPSPKRRKSNEEPKQPKPTIHTILAGIFHHHGEGEEMKEPVDEAEGEIIRYVREEPLEVEGRPLNWWRDNEKRFKTLALVARKFLCIPA